VTGKETVGQYNLGMSRRKQQAKRETAINFRGGGFDDDGADRLQRRGKEELLRSRLWLCLTEAGRFILALL
jgi:hypothetical protein